MPSQEDIQKLEAALAEARASLQSEQTEQGAGNKTAPQEPPTQETETAPDLRAQIAEEVKNALGAKSDQVQGRVDVGALVREAVQEALKGQQAQAQSGTDIKAIVAEVLAEHKSPRKTPLAHPENEEEQTGRGSKGGGTYIPKHHLGDKANFNTFLCAVGRKDRGTIHDIQQEFGVVGYGGKALVEGTGALDTVAGPSGGFLVPPEFSQDLIPLLYPYVILRRAGAKTYTMRSPQFYRPRLTGGATASYIGETAAIPSSQQTFDQFSLLAKELTALVPVSRLLVEDSDPAVEDIIKTDMSQQIGLKEDKTFLTGTGSSTVPQGLLSRSDIQNITVVDTTNGDALTYDTIVDIETALDLANIPEVNRIWIAHPKLRGTLRKIKDQNLRPIFSEFLDPQQSTLLAGRPNGNNVPQSTLFGKPFYTSTQLPTRTVNGHTTYDLALVEVSQVVIGQLGGMEVAMSDEASFVDGSNNTISAFQSNLSLFRMVLRHDVNIEHPSAVVVRQGILP
jgi:HK97 family phage major capsid protein